MDWKTNILNLEDKSKIEEKISSVRESTGVELVLVVVKNSSSYSVARLRLAILFPIITTVALLIKNPDWGPKAIPMMSIVQMLSAVLGYILSQFNLLKKYALTNSDLEKEVAFRGKEVFLNLHIPGYKSQSGVLILYHVFEKKVDIVIDDHLKSKIRSNDILRIRELLCKEFKSTGHRNNLMNVLNIVEEKILHFFPEGRNPEREFESNNHVLWMVFK